MATGVLVEGIAADISQPPALGRSDLLERLAGSSRDPDG